MDETQIKQLISEAIAGTVGSIKTEIMTSVNETLNGYDAKQKRLNQIKPKDSPEEPDESGSRIAELERRLAEKEAQEIKSKKALAVNEYVSRHQASPDFGEYFLLKYEQDISINKDGSMKVGSKTLEEALDSFKEDKGSAFFPATVKTEPNEEGQVSASTQTSDGFNAAAFASLFT